MWETKRRSRRDTERFAVTRVAAHTHTTTHGGPITLADGSWCRAHLGQMPGLRRGQPTQQQNDQRTCEERGGRWRPGTVTIQGRKRVRRTRVEKDEFQPTCPICLENYGKHRIPWACEACEHYFCHRCFSRLLHASCAVRRYSFACPLCRNPCREPHVVIPI